MTASLYIDSTRKSVVQILHFFLLCLKVIKIYRQKTEKVRESIMDNIINTIENKHILSLCVGTVGGFVASWFGGWDAAITTLLIFMGIDFISGVIVAGVFHASKKTETGALSSAWMAKGLFKKCMMIAFVLIAYRLDLMIGTDYIRDAVIIAFCVSELLSIIENAGLMGVPMPTIIIKAVDVLKQKAGDFEKKLDDKTKEGDKDGIHEQSVSESK